MRTPPIVTACLLSVAAAVAAQQESPDARTPKKGDTIIVKGCLRGGALESTETSILDGTGRYDTALVYRLKGSKDTLKKMRDEHDGELVEVTGELKSSLPSANERRGTQIGKTRVFIGAGSPHVSSPAQSEATRSIPVLEVKSYEGHAVKCTR